MKKWNLLFILFIIVIISCTSSKALVKNKNTTASPSDTIRIANEELEYEVIIIDPGFNTWLNSRAFPRGYHTQAYLENKNLFYITEWNNRVMQPQRYNSRLYEMTIDYDPHINYGYEVNYLIYNYMIYFQNTYKQKLYGNVPLR
ncbi:DUF6146 family protein [Flavobacterium sp. NG2]|uniref:DUF6146 family protein n=1 Tax=Flavobacterium sp. NG2 TaxID=3097547 RepID=UPI002A8117F7|nr:DUF6146 family protein [Flavobacterium sp. NG2]WPR71253.1 DUF6146 family protein [Flavobacterium sp. NG2]